MARELKPCGTVAAYERHRRVGEPACEACKEAKRAAQRERTGGKPRRPAYCGTRSGYVRHQRHRETPCAECKGAHAKYEVERRARKRGTGTGEGR